MGLGFVTIYKPRITVSAQGNGTYSADMTKADRNIKAKPAELVWWTVTVPAGFPGSLYIQFVDQSLPAPAPPGNPVDGPFHNLRRLDWVPYRENPHKTVYVIPGGFLGQFSGASFPYEVWHDDGSGVPKRLIDPEILVDGDANPPLTSKKLLLPKTVAAKVTTTHVARRTTATKSAKKAKTANKVKKR